MTSTSDEGNNKVEKKGKDRLGASEENWSESESSSSLVYM